MNDNSKSRKLRACIVGCGRVAAHHAKFLAQMTAEVEIAAVVDVNQELAREFADRYGIKAVYRDIAECLTNELVDVMHIVTPPAFHYKQSMAALEKGVSVFIEKPMVFSYEEAQALYQMADGHAASVCPDFIQLFHPIMVKAATLVRSGRLGKVVSCDCHLGIDLNIPELWEAPNLHWSFNMPGGLLHNYMTHALYLVLDWVGTPESMVVAPKAYGTLPRNLTDHLDVMISGSLATSRVILSCVTKPYQYSIHIFCEEGSVLVDFNTATMIVDEKSRLPAVLKRATASYSKGYDYMKQATGNLVDFLRGRLVPYHGLKNIIDAYYKSIRLGGQAPVSRDLALAVTKAEEMLIARMGKVYLDSQDARGTTREAGQSGRILLTGATGYVGSEIARRLKDEKFSVRAYARLTSHTEGLEKLGVEIAHGDVRDYDKLAEACDGVDIIVHVAAALRGSERFMVQSGKGGAENIAKAAKAKGVKRVIYISSMSIYGYDGLRSDDIISEQTPLEAHPERRGGASMAKIRAEEVALTQLDAQPPWTILRPSLIFGNGRDLLSPLGVKLGQTVVSLGTRGKHLRLVHVRDTAEAVCVAIRSQATAGKVFNISSPDDITMGDYVDRVVRKSRHKDKRIVFVPYCVAFFGVVALKVLRSVSKRMPSMNFTRLRYLYCGNKVDSKSFSEATGWRPSTPLLHQLEAEVRKDGVLDNGTRK